MQNVYINQNQARNMNMNMEYFKYMTIVKDVTHSIQENSQTQIDRHNLIYCYQ